MRGAGTVVGKVSAGLIMLGLVSPDKDTSIKKKCDLKP